MPHIKQISLKLQKVTEAIIERFSGFTTATSTAAASTLQYNFKQYEIITAEFEDGRSEFTKEALKVATQRFATLTIAEPIAAKVALKVTAEEFVAVFH